MENKKEITWRDIKNAANEMTEEELDRPPFVWSENDERGCRVVDILPLEEDYLWDGDDACAARSDMQGALEDEAEEYPGEESEYYVVHPAGTKILVGRF